MSRTPRTDLIAAIRRSGPSRRRGRPVTAHTLGSAPWSRRPSLFLRQGHDDLCLARGLEKVRETHHCGEERRLRALVRLERAEGGDPTLEAGVDRLQAVAGRALEHHGHETFLHEVLGHEQLFDAIT